MGLVIGLVIGFVTGARAKQMLSAMTNAARALVTLFKLRGADAAASPSAGDAGDTEAVAPETEEEEPAEEILLNFLNSEATPGLDDHAQLEFNPIVLYQMKKAKEHARQQKIREQILAEGLDPDDESSMAMLQSSAVGLGNKANALATLIAHGARTTAVGNANAEDRLQKERRQQVKNVETYLTKQLNIDASRRQTPRESKRIGGAAHTSALEVAIVSSAPSPRALRNTRQVQIATAGRQQLAEFQRLHPEMSKPLPPTETEQRRGAEALSLDDLEAIRAEMADLQLEAEPMFELDPEVEA